MLKLTVNKQDNSTEKVCHIAEASKLIGDFWNILIVRELLKGCKRFNELQESVSNITNSTLSDRLKTLTESGVVERRQYECIPPKVEYSLTPRGRALQKIVEEIELFGTNWI